MSPRAQKAFAWCGAAFVVVFLAGIVLARLLPPQSPSDGPQQVYDFYDGHRNGTRLGLLLMLAAATFMGPFAAVISVQLKRIEGTWSPATYTQLIGAATGALAIVLPVLLFTAAAFRADRSPELVQALNDLAWIAFIMNFPPAVMQVGAIALATLSDRRQVPVFPRWVGYYNAWTGLLFVPAGLLTFFKAGPFAWNGLVSFWVAALAFGSWFVVMNYATLQAIDRGAQEDELRELSGQLA